MNDKVNNIQDSELEVMQVLWAADGPMPLAQIRAILHERCHWEDSTIKTLLRRLQAKNAVELVSRGMYAPLVPQEAYNQLSARNFVDKIFAGSARDLVAALVEEGSLSAADLAELSAMFRVEEK